MDELAKLSAFLNSPQTAKEPLIVNGMGIQKDTGNCCIKDLHRNCMKIIVAVRSKKFCLSPRQALDGRRVLRIPGRIIKLATWKFENVQAKMARLDIHILGISNAGQRIV